MAYRGLAVDGKHQSILVSGESGAGKTETVKIVMRHVSSVSGGTGGDGSPSVIVQRVLDGQPLLEAFGNAKTVRNDNSSRFGKFLQLQFDVEDATQAAYSGRAIPNCVLAGSTCETYLLEKSRVVSHEGDERTYHIFYQVLAAADEYKQQYMPHLLGKANEDFQYVGHTKTTVIEGKHDGEQFVKTLNALKILDMDENSLKNLFMAVSVVMQLGNISFKEDPEDSEKCVIANKSELSILAEWFGASPDILEQALTFRTVVAGKEQYKVPLQKGDARDGTDAFSKEIYQQIFLWLVGEINRMTCAEMNYSDAADVEEYGLIGLLDIFGFESFEVNRFEQLCINYTNEKLQQKYTIDIFRSVQEEYSHEGIDLGDIIFSDNADVLQLIEGKIGVISVLNEECVRPKGNDTSFVSKVKSVNKESSCLISQKLHKPNEFAIEHYAGVVTYDATNFVQKNTDALPKDLIECACLSSNSIIQVEIKAAADAKVVGSVGKRGAATLTVATKFKAQLARLMADVTQTKTRYIRCIKPNPEKVPLQMNMLSSAEQLRCAGVVAAVTISRVAFPNRLMHETALERFSCLCNVTLDSLIQRKKPPNDDDLTGYREVVEEIFDGLLKDMEKKEAGGNVKKSFQCGKSRIYFRLGALETLEAKRLVALGVFATAIQRVIRGFTARSLFWKLKYACIESQGNARRVIARKRFLRGKASAIRMECWVRCVYSKRELKALQRDKAATKVQSQWRTRTAEVMLLRCRKATIEMQRIIRGAIQRPKFRQALKEAEEEARVNSKLAALQKRLQEAEMKFFQADKLRIEAEKRAAGVTVESTAASVVPSTDESAPAVDAPPGTDQQKELIDESNEMLDYFRKEVFKLKSANYLLRTDLASVQEEFRALQSHSQSTEASYSAMTKNIGKLSLNNMRLAHQLGEEKDFILKLKKDLKQERIRYAAEISRKTEEVLGRDKMHDAEVTRLNRELVHLRQIITDNGIEIPEEQKLKLNHRGMEQKFERASFHKDPSKESVLITKQNQMESSLAKATQANSTDEDSGMKSSLSSALTSDNDGNRRLQTSQYPSKRPVTFGSSFGGPPNTYHIPYRGGPPSSRPPPFTPMGRGRGPFGVGGRGRGSPGYPGNLMSSPSTTYKPPTKLNTGTSLGVAVTSKTQSSLEAQAKSGSSLAAAAVSKVGTGSSDVTAEGSTSIIQSRSSSSLLTAAAGGDGAIPSKTSNSSLSAAASQNSGTSSLRRASTEKK
jgi:myosin V